ncbi:MAG: branched-subunit amino acid transport protein [Arenicella sp.]|jgi:branched-subunit amino acid transport protein
MTWLLLLGMALITFVNRYLFFSTAIYYSPGVRLRRFLSYSSYSVLTAIWAPIIFRFDGQSQLQFAGIDYLLAAVLAGLLSFYRVASIIVVVLSTALFFLIRYYLSWSL